MTSKFLLFLAKAFFCLFVGFFSSSKKEPASHVKMGI